MKLKDVIVENLLDALRTSGGPTFAMNNPGATDGSTVKAIKQLLSRHTLVTGVDKNTSSTFPYLTAGKAWGGPVNATWDQALDNAIKTWKQSINIQLGDNRLNTQTGELANRDLEMLQANLIKGGQMDGLLEIIGDKVTARTKKGPGHGMTFDVNTVIDTPVEEVRNTVDLINAITPSGWHAIMYELCIRKGMNYQQSMAELSRLIPVVYERQDQMPDMWLTNVWLGQIVLKRGTRTKAVLANGKEMPFYIPLSGGGGYEKQAQKAYVFFKELANGLLEKFRNAENVAKKDKINPAKVDINPTFKEIDKVRWITAMNEALENDWIAFIPGGRSVDNDVGAVATLMSQLQTVGDWDMVEDAYNAKFTDDLSVRLNEELDETEYASHVVRHLMRIRRINPRQLLGAVQFGDTQELEVEFNGEKYKLSKEDNNPVVKLGTGEITDVLLIDDVLKTAITNTGGNIPDINAEITPENMQTAGEMVVTVLNDQLPEMVAFYTNQTPFDESDVARILGPERLLGLQNEVGIQIANNFDTTYTMSFIYNEIMDDRKWLIGDGTEDNPGAANVHFDVAYEEESQGKTGFSKSADDVELSDDDKDIVNRLLNNQTRGGALIELSQATDPSQYKRIYRGMVRETKAHAIDVLAIKDSDELMEYILGNNNEVPEEFKAVIEAFGVAIAAPMHTAKLFKESQTDQWGFFGIGTNDEAMSVLVGLIRNREDYLNVNERYREQGFGEDLINDIDGEQVAIWNEGSYVEELKAKIGRRSDVELARLNLPSVLQDRLSAVLDDPSVENLKDVKSFSTGRNLTEISQLEAVLTFLHQVVTTAPSLDDEQQAILLEIVDHYGELGKVIDEKWYNDDFAEWKTNNSQQWFS